MNREDFYSSESLTFDTRAEDLRHVWIPLSIKVFVSKTSGLDVRSWSETDEVRNCNVLCSVETLHVARDAIVLYLFMFIF